MNDRGALPPPGDDPKPVRMQLVVARISIRTHEACLSAAPDFDEIEPGDTPDLEPSAASSRAGFPGFAVPWADRLPSSADLANRLPSAAVEAFLAAVAIMLVTRDGRFAVAGAAIVGLAVLWRAIDRRVTFSFGAGFLGYRSDMGWPQGVQEDDDFRWNWRSGSSSGSVQANGHAGPPS